MRTIEKIQRKQESINLPSSIKWVVKIVATAVGFYVWGIDFIWVVLGSAFLLEYPKGYRILPPLSYRSDWIFLVFSYSHFLIPYRYEND